MCGIWGHLSNKSINLDELFTLFYSIKNRGPDTSHFEIKTFNEWFMYIGFHRLAIRDLSMLGDQPFHLVVNEGNRQIISVINGEIYNYKYLVEKYNLQSKLVSKSDCEIIQYIYYEHGIQELVDNLIGEYAIGIFDFDYSTKEFNIYLARDQFGVRPLFYGKTDTSFSFCSELKGIYKLVNNDNDCQVSPGHYIKYDVINNKLETTCFYSKDYIPNLENNNLGIIKKNIRQKLKQATRMMIDSDRPIGALLSGGLDSSLIVSIVSKHLKQINKKLSTFSIGIPGATDKIYAEMVSQFCDTNHTHIEFSQEDFLKAIPTVIKTIESYDITTVRASVGQYLICKWISENTDIKVLFIGDGSDELTCGYMYFHKAPNAIEAHYDNSRLLREIHYYDVLRADRGVAENGLEARVPFLNVNFVDYYMSVDPNLRVPTNGIEKWLLRTSFDNGKYLPDKVLWRTKEAFSDGVSSEEKSWYQIIQENVQDYIKDYLQYNQEFNYLTPVSQESLYYRLIFNSFYPGFNKVIPHYWLPSWHDTNEPSARTIKNIS